MVMIGAVGLLAACGSSSPNNPTGSGGSGGAGGAGGAGGGPTGQQACLDYCHKLETNNCMGQLGDCTMYCDDLFEEAGTECADEAGKFFECMLPLASSCPTEQPMECADEEEAVEACFKANTCAGECNESNGPDGASSCGCTETCQGKDYETQCDTPAGGMTTCQCLVEGSVVGTCTNATAAACGVKESCCQDQYFKIP